MSNSPFHRSLDRRQFLGLSAALAASGVLRAESADPYGGFKVGAQSYTFRQFDLERALKSMQEAGLKYAEFFRKHVPVESSDRQIEAIKTLCKDHGISPIGFGVERFSKDHAANQRIFEFGKKLGLYYLSADPEPDSFDSLDKLVEEYKIAIAIHPHGPSGKNLHRWYSAEIILEAVKDHHPLIGACLDTGHLIRSAQPPFEKKLDSADQIRKMGKRNFGIHLKDHDNERRTDVVIGKGNLNVTEVLKALKEVGFQGGLNLEYEANPENPLDDVKACVAVLKESVKALS